MTAAGRKPAAVICPRIRCNAVRTGFTTGGISRTIAGWIAVRPARLRACPEPVRLGLPAGYAPVAQPASQRLPGLYTKPHPQHTYGGGAGAAQRRTCRMQQRQTLCIRQPRQYKQRARTAAAQGGEDPLQPSDAPNPFSYFIHRSFVHKTSQPF